MMKKVQDHFSESSDLYKTFRPEYPQAIYDWIIEECSERITAWDCGTGNGQVAKGLSPLFSKVIASDISQEQIDQAHRAANIFYFKSRSEHTGFFESSFDLITVAQALHWYDHTAFSKEVNRVLKTKGLLAVWGYHLLRINSKIDLIIDHFYQEIVGPYWAPERKHVDQRYENIQLDLSLLKSSNDMFIELDWDRNQFFGYLSTWSASKTYTSKNQKNPIELIQSRIESNWGEGEIMKVRFPLFAKLYRKE